LPWPWARRIVRGYLLCRLPTSTREGSKAVTEGYTNASCDRLSIQQQELLAYMSSQANSKRITRQLSQGDLASRIYKSTLKRGLIRTDLRVLEDEDLIEKLEDGYYRIVSDLGFLASR